MGPGMALSITWVSAKALVCVAALGFLQACGAGAGLSGAMAGLRGNQAVDLDALPRTKIEEFGMPILRAKVPALGLDLLMSIRDTRGDVVTWEAAEGITFAFRDGVLIESRGLGPDLMSMSGPSSAQIQSGTIYRRNYFFVSSEERNEPRVYTCAPVLAGSESVTIYGLEYATQHFQEECTRDVGRIANNYWFESGTLRQSIQWISPAAGYAEFSRVID